EANRDALRFFAEGAKVERCRYPVDLTLGFEAAYPHLPKLKNAAGLLAASALLHSQSDQGREAADDLLSALALGRSLLNEPSLLSQSGRLASRSPAVAGLERTLNPPPVPASSLSELSVILQQLETFEARGDGFHHALVGERVNALAILQAPEPFLQKLTAGSTMGLHADERQRWIEE